MTAAKERLWQLQHRLAPYLFIAPFFILFCCFMLYPLYRSVVMSFYKYAGPNQHRFVGISNYTYVLRDRIFMHGRSVDAVLYSIVRSGWPAPSVLVPGRSEA